MKSKIIIVFIFVFGYIQGTLMAGEHPDKSPSEWVSLLYTSLIQQTDKSIKKSIYQFDKLGLYGVVLDPLTTLGTTRLSHYIDTSSIQDKPIVVLLTHQQYLDHNDRICHQELEWASMAEFNNRYIDQIIKDPKTHQMYETLLSPIDMRLPRLTISTQDIPNPMIESNKHLYHYRWDDRVVINNEVCRQIIIVPKFRDKIYCNGLIYFSAHAPYHLRKIVLEVAPKGRNIQIEAFRIEQDYEDSTTGVPCVSNEKLELEFFINTEFQNIYICRNRNYYQGEAPVGVSADSTPFLVGASTQFNSQIEEYNNWFERLVLSKSIKTMVWLVKLYTKGYIPIRKDSSLIDIGPIYETVNLNKVEGLRFKLGYETTAFLHKRFFLNGGLAYGILDKRLKYNGTFYYSFIDKPYHVRQFPIHAISIGYRNDIERMGESPIFPFQNNLLYYLKQSPTSLMKYYQQVNLEYQYEHLSGFSLKSWLLHKNEQAAGSLEFNRYSSQGNRSDEGRCLLKQGDMTSFEAGITLRYAPMERFRQGRVYRYNLINRMPIIELTHRVGIPGIFGSQYYYQYSELSYQQRIRLAMMGRLDIHLKAGKVWNSGVDFLYLPVANANTSVAVMDGAFALIAPLEFISDQYLSLELGLYTELLFHYIPYISRWKFREALGFKLYWGHLSDKNNPSINRDLLVLPSHSQPLTTEPYMEFNIGIDNILGLFRVDYVGRINYLSRKDTKKHGVRLSLTYTF